MFRYTRYRLPVVSSLILVLTLALTAGGAPLAAQHAPDESQLHDAAAIDEGFRSSPVVSIAPALQNQHENGDLQVLLRGGVVAADSLLAYETVPQSEDYPQRSTVLPEQLGTIAFESDRNGGFDLFTQEVGTNSSAVAWLVAAGDDVTPEWSPDGSKIVYASNRDGDFEIYVRTMGGQEQKLTNNSAEDAHPSWSPSGDRIIFTSNRNGDYFQIYSMRADGSDVRQIGVIPGNHAMSPYYSPDGSRIAFMRASVAAPVCQWNWDVWTMAADGSNQRRITSHLAADMYPRWSPDGSLIIFAGCRNFLDFDLYTINWTTNVERRLTSWFLSNEWGGTYSTDNRYVAFSSDIDANVEIYIMPAGGGSATNLTRHSADDGVPSWKPAGTTPTPPPAAYTISGRVTDANGRGIPGVTVSAGFPRMTTTDTNGNYTFAGLTAGTYTISPSRYLYTFSPASRTVSVPPNATGQDFVQMPAADLRVDRIEVSQVFVEKDDPTTGTPIPLIAKKDTLVRVYVGLTGVTSVHGVTARLHLRNAFGIERTITQDYNPWPVTVTQSPNPLHLQDTINFRPPPELLWGPITFWADVDPENQIPETNESNNTGGQIVHSFQSGKPLRVAWTVIGYKRPNSSEVITPSFQIAVAGDTTLRQIYPVGENDVEYFYQPGDSEVVDNKFSSQTTAAYLKAANRFWQNVSRSNSWKNGTPDRLYAWVAGEARDPNTICGVADALWNSGDGRVAVGVEECDKEFSGVLKDIQPDEVLVHELGHLLNGNGLRHTPNDLSPECFGVPAGPDSDYPSATPKGSIIAHGLDIEGYRVFDPEHTYDFMTYCKPSWVSPFNYQKLNSGFKPPASAAKEAHLTSPTRQLIVSGMVYSPTLRVEFDPFYAVLSTVPPSADTGSAYCLEALASDNQLLASRCFNLGFSHPEEWGRQVPNREVADSFVLSIPYPAGTARIVLRHRGVPIAARSVSPHAPTVRLISPNGGEMWSGTGAHVVTWTASDQDGDTLHFALHYSTDGGVSWIPAGIDLVGTSHTLDVSRLPGGTSILLRISATDGVNTTSDVSDAPFTVGRKPPMAFILGPEDGARFFPGQAILLRGRAFDLEDGTPPDTAYRWQSNRDGDLGTGATNLVVLSPGPHVITLTATDSDGARTTATIRLSAGARMFLPIVLRSR